METLIRPPTRRDFLRGAGALGAAMVSCQSAIRPDPYGGFRMGMESWCLRAFGLEETLAKYRELGLSYAEIYPPSHMPVTADPAAIARYKAALDREGVTPWAIWGDFTGDHEANRAVFEFARAFGARVLPGDLTPDAFESVDRLAREYGLKVAIHNHGPESLYDKISDVARAVEKWPVAIGACVDTGNFIRSGEDPAEAIRTLGPRVHAVHLKDSDGHEMSTVMGKGKLDLAAVLRALKEIRFDECLALEYEQNPDNPMEDLKDCLAAVRRAVTG
jgi:sugar phosphate isomerase/epimerase